MMGAFSHASGKDGLHHDMKVDLGCDQTIFRQTNSDVLGAADPSCLICTNKIDRFLAREISFLLQLLSHFPSLLHNLAKVLRQCNGHIDTRLWPHSLPSFPRPKISLPMMSHQVHICSVNLMPTPCRTDGMFRLPFRAMLLVPT